MDRRLAGVIALFLALLAASAFAAADIPRRGDDEEYRCGDDERAHWAEAFVNNYVPNLIDSPATDMVDRNHPTLEMRYVRTRFGSGSFSNVSKGSRYGVRVDSHFRVSRDFQFSLSGPFYKEKVSLFAGPAPDIPGTVSALCAEIKYLVPVEIAGFRTVVGGRLASSKERSHPLFMPGDFMDFASLYVAVSRVFAPTIRVHSVLMHVEVPQPDDLVSNGFWHYGFGFENQLYTLRENWVRWLLEFNCNSYDRRAYNYYGNLSKLTEPYFNTGLRAKTGIVHLDAAVKYFARSGHSEWTVGVTKRFWTH